MDEAYALQMMAFEKRYKGKLDNTLVFWMHISAGLGLRQNSVGFFCFSMLFGFCVFLQNYSVEIVQDAEKLKRTCFCTKIML